MATATSANLNINIDTFSGVVAKINELLTDISTIVLTASANTIGAATTGNSTLVGIFGANSFVVGTGGLGGGTLTVPAAFTITSNVTVNGALATFNANTTFGGLTTTIGGTLTINGTALSTTVPTTFTNTVTISGNTLIANVSSNGNLIQTGTGTLGTSGTRWNTYSQNLDSVVITSNTVTANIISVASNMDIKPTVIANLGANTTSPQVITSSPTATYRSGVLNVQATSPAGDYQVETFTYIQNTANVYYTTSGIVYSNTQLYTMAAVINGANVDINVTQNIANLAIRIISNLMKV